MFLSDPFLRSIIMRIVLPNNFIRVFLFFYLIQFLDTQEPQRQAGILKSPLAHKKFPVSPKKVQFEGVPSYDSSNSSEQASGTTQETIVVRGQKHFSSKSIKSKDVIPGEMPKWHINTVVTQTLSFFM